VITLDAPTAVVYFTEPREVLDFDPSSLIEMFDFTPSEARVACLLAGGADLAAVADHLCVSLNTVRTHLRRACGKACVSRQAELAVLVLRVCRPLQKAS
jgi:DNA-binding CsgD family transcriptional regulator